MPSERYFRWQSTGDEDDDDQETFPGFGEELDVDYPGEEETSATPTPQRVVTILRPRQSINFRKRRRVQLPIIGYQEFTSKSICLLVLTCSLCVSVGLLLGYTLRSPQYPSPSSHTPPTSSPSSEPYRFIPRFGGRDFTIDTAVRLQSYLTTQMVNAYARRLNHIPEGQVADYVSSTLRIQGFSTRTKSFSATLSTPDSSNPNTVEAIHFNGSVTTLNQPVLQDGSLPYAAYSSAGEVEGDVVYGHRGNLEDLFVLRRLGVTIKGAILLLQHGSDSEGAQVRRAESFGAAGILFYPDPSLFRGNGTKYPHGSGLPDDGVISPSLKLVPGDPATLHYPSLSHVYKKPQNSFEDIVPKIPVQPISYNTAKIILENLGGPEVPSKWRGGTVVTNISINSSKGGHQTVFSPSVQHIGGYWRNNSTITRIRIRVHNLLRERRVTNVHAWLPCHDSSKVVHIGAGQGSRGGAGIGLASLLAIGESMARSMTNGTGRRLLLSAWADSRLGWIGSTEFTELHAGWLESTALAYLDISSTVGALRGLRLQATPLLHETFREAAHFVAWPEQEALSVLEGWRMGGGKEYDIAFENLGCWSNAISFSAVLGIASAQFSVAQPMPPSRCREGDCDVCYGMRQEFPLSLSQYDTTEAAVDLLDPGLDWTTAMASLVGVSALVLTESELPPVNFKGDFSGSLVDGWWSFLHHHLPALNHTQYNFTEIVDAIRNELYVLQTDMDHLTAWYKMRPDNHDPYQMFRHDEDRIESFMRVSRSMLGPRGVGRLFTNTLTGGSDLVEDPVHSLHHHIDIENIVPSSGTGLKDKNSSNTEASQQLPPSNILAIQTNSGFSESSYNNLAFSAFYKEEDKPRPHSWFPQVSHALTQVLAKKSSWENLHKELSLLLSALTSFRTLIPIQV